jgi:predicted nuclease with TOPRIM domain
MKRDERLKRLESLVEKSSKSLARLRAENAKLNEKISKLQGDKQRLEVDFRKFKTMSRRQEKFRGRLERAVRKIDRILGMAGSR